MTIYHDPRDPVDETDTGARSDEFVPETDAALRSALEDVQLPATVDEVTDQLIEPAQPPIDTWADVHEQLHRTRLPSLDDAGHIEFDEFRGIVERTDPRADEGRPFSPAVVGTVSVVVLLVLLALISVSIVTAFTVTVITTTVVIWLVPSFV
ncbi:hypothetical protein AB7C87_17555 [Natrarchaeobius sp. A-rgal3]|uniref:hypothetical protein n=1 Tax=Natrarchaeobius versutus TaxID=1679078 RepID=UPI00350ED706